jgi:hypothetical protein
VLIDTFVSTGDQCRQLAAVDLVRGILQCRLGTLSSHSKTAKKMTASLTDTQVSTNTIVQFTRVKARVVMASVEHN